MGEEDELGALFSREEVLGGLPARRARALLFLIDQRSARRASALEVGTMSMLGERSAEARELEWVEHFAMDREPGRPAIQEIEAAAGDWEDAVPAGASVRAATLRLLAERYPLDRRHLPRTIAALGLDEPAVAAAYESQAGEPIAAVWSEVGPLERLRWAISVPGRWLEETTPLKAAAALTFLTSMGQSVVIIPLAMAAVGPVAGLVGIVVIGLLALSATAAVSETAARSVEIRYRGGFFGRLLANSLGAGAGFVPAAAGIIGVVLPTISALVGLGLLLAIVLPLPAAAWVAIAGGLVTLVPLRGGRSASFGGLLSFGIFSLTLLLALSVLVLLQAAFGEGFFEPQLGVPGEITVEAALGVAIGVLVASYADPVYATQIGRIVLPNDPDGRGLVRGSVLGMAGFVVFTALFSFIVLFTVPTDDLIGLSGSVMDPLSGRYGAVVTVLAGLIGMSLFGMRLYGNAISLYDFVDEQLPGRKLPRVVLTAGTGRVVLTDREGDGSPIVLAYRGPRAGKPVLAVSRQGADGGDTSERRLGGIAPEHVAEGRVGLRVLEFDHDKLHVELETELAIAYDDEAAILGRGVAETLLAEDGSGALAAWLLREGGADAETVAAHLGVAVPEARARLEQLVAAGSARERDGRFEPLVAARRPRGAGLESELWERIGANADGTVAEPGRPDAEAGFAGRAGRKLLCSIPMIALTVLVTLLVVAGTGSVSGPFKITGVIVIGLIAGVLPPLLLVASRRRPEVAGIARSGWLVSPPLLAAMLLGALVMFVLHATILWTDPLERSIAAATFVAGLFVVAVSVRHGAYRRTAVLDLREGEPPAGIDALVERDGVVERPRMRIGGADVPAGGRPALGADAVLDVAGFSGAADRLRVSAQRLGATGAAGAMPVEIELRGTEISEVHRLDELGGVALFDLSAPDWTLIVRRPPQSAAAADADPDPGSAGETEEPIEIPPRRRRRGGGDSPLDKL